MPRTLLYRGSLYQGFTVLITYPCEGGTVSRLLPPTCIPVNKVTGKQSVKKIHTWTYSIVWQFLHVAVAYKIRCAINPPPPPPWVVDSMKEDEGEPNVILSSYNNSLNKCQIPTLPIWSGVSWFNVLPPALATFIRFSRLIMKFWPGKIAYLKYFSTTWA